MAQKKITDLQLRDAVTSDLNLPSDDGIQSYRVTAAQLRDFVTAAISQVPTGVVLPFAGSSAPTGFLLCDGAAVSRTTYATLFALIGTTYGSGDGSTTFNVPNTSGVFIQGVGTQTISSKSFVAGSLGTKSRDSTALPVTPITTGIESANHVHGPNDTYFVTSFGSAGQTVNAGNSTLAWNYKTTTGTQSANHTHSTSGGDTYTKPGSIVSTVIKT